LLVIIVLVGVISYVYGITRCYTGCVVLLKGTRGRRGKKGIKGEKGEQVNYRSLQRTQLLVIAQWLVIAPM